MRIFSFISFASICSFLLFLSLPRLVVSVSAVPSSGSAEWVRIVLEDDRDSPFHGRVTTQHRKICDRLKSAHNRRGFLTEKDRGEACTYVCYSVVPETECNVRDVSSTNFSDKMLSWLSWAEDEDSLIVEDDVIETWWIILTNQWPLLLTFIPVLLQQYKSYRWPQAVICLTVFTTMIFLFDFSYAQMIYLSTVGVACLISTGPHGVVPEVVGATLTIIVFVCVSFMLDPVVQIGTAVLIFIVYLTWLSHTFVTRRQGSIPGIIVMISVLMVIADQISVLRQSYKLHTFNMDVFEMVLNSIIPNGGSMYYIKNAMRLSVFASKHIAIMSGWAAGKQIQLFVIFTLFQMVISVVFKSLFGMFVILGMRYQFTPDHFVKGFLIYMCDLFGGSSYIVKVTFGIEKFEQRRASYSLLNVVFMIFESRYGIEILFLRFIFWFCDNYLFRTNYATVSKYLNLDMCQSVFPQDGAHPWVAIDRISCFAEHVVRIKGEHFNGETYIGLGFLRSGGVRKTFLLSVNHVVQKMKRIHFTCPDGRKTVIESPTPSNFEGDYDPVSSLTLGPEYPGASIDLLDVNEIPFVDSLTFIKRDREGTMMAFVSKFHFDKDNEIRASITLEKGDSGGPVFAMMKDGQIRYAGCVSSGDPNQFRGNFISSITGYDPGNGLLDSDSDSMESDTGRNIIFQTAKPAKSVERAVDTVNRMSQGFFDRCSGAIVIDESSEDPFKGFDDDTDVVDYFKRADDKAEAKIDSDNKKPRKKRNRMSDTLSADLQGMFTILSDLVGDNLATRFINDARRLKRPRLQASGTCVSFTPVTKKEPPAVRTGS